MSQYNRGGQRRTCISLCGFTCKGSIREVNYKHKLHKKVCDICKDLKVEDVPYSRTAGEANGWGGIDAKGNKVKTNLSHLSVNGEYKGVYTGESFEDILTKFAEEETELEEK